MSGKKKPCVYRLVGPEEIFNKAPFMGLYTEVPPPHTEAKAENTKSVSVHSGGKFKIFYCPAKNQWIVGVDVVSGEGWLYIESNAATPDKARGGWSYWDSARNKWVCDRNLTVVLVSGGNAPDVDVSQVCSAAMRTLLPSGNPLTVLRPPSSHPIRRTSPSSNSEARKRHRGKRERPNPRSTRSSPSRAKQRPIPTS